MTLRKWVRRAEVDDGLRPCLTIQEREHLKPLERENRELRRANEMAQSTGRQAGSASLVAFHLADPGPKRLGRHAELRGHGTDRRPLRRVLGLMLEHHAHRSFADLLRILGRSGHGSIRSRGGASKIPGAVHTRTDS